MQLLPVVEELNLEMKCPESIIDCSPLESKKELIIDESKHEEMESTSEHSRVMATEEKSNIQMQDDDKMQL